MASQLYENEIIIDDEYEVRHRDSLMMGARGYDPSTVDTSIYGMMAPPTDIPLIPRSEWSERIKEKERTGTTLSRLLRRASIPSTDQNGHGYSHTEDTEVLTEKGWVRWPDWNHSDLLATVNPVTHAMEFQAHTEWHASEYSGEMYHSVNRRIDFGVTDYHRMYVRKWDERRRTLSDQYSFVNASDLGWYCGLMHAPGGWRGTELIELGIPGGRTYDGDDFLAMLSLVLSDGYASGADKSLVSFCCFENSRYEMVAALAHRIGFTEQPSRRGVWNARDYNLAEWVRQNCYTNGELSARTKRIPDIVKVASSRQINSFLAFYGYKDHKKFASGEGYAFYSSSKRIIDDLQELLLRVGKRGSIAEVGEREATMKNGKSIRSGKSFVLYASKTENLCLERKKHIETDRYKGLVYCATVPNGLLVTRRNGSVLISGNCWAYSTGGCVQVLREFSGQPFIELNPHSVASIIKKGADQGGWCGLSARFLMEHGIAPMGGGPGEWPKHSRAYTQHEPRCRERMSQFRVTEGWIDLRRADHDQEMTFDQVMSCLLANIPCALDFNWWGHSVMGCDPVEVSTNQFGIRIRNSWTDSWGSLGFSVLTGSKAIPNGAVGLRVTGAVAK